MKDAGIPVRLDRVRMLLINEAAFHLIKQRTGVNLAAIMRENIEGFEFTLPITRGLILAGCHAEDPRLTMAMVSEFVTAENYQTFHEPIVKAIMRGLGIAYQP